LMKKETKKSRLKNKIMKILRSIKKPRSRGELDF
jgi:hypothetical protein